jgi:hypothetical protein
MQTYASTKHLIIVEHYYTTLSLGLKPRQPTNQSVGMSPIKRAVH